MEGTNSNSNGKQQTRSNLPTNLTKSDRDSPPSKKEPVCESPSDHNGDNTERYQKAFTVYYAKLCDAVPVEKVLPHLVSNEVITVREMEDVLTEKTAFRQARALLNGPIWRAINGGYPQSFVRFLCVLHSIRSCQTLSKEICTKFNISSEEIASKSSEFKSASYFA